MKASAKFHLRVTNCLCLQSVCWILLMTVNSGSKDLISLLRQRSRPYSFSNSLPPPVVGTASKVFDMLMNDNSLVEKINKNTQRYVWNIFQFLILKYFLCLQVPQLHDPGRVHDRRRGSSDISSHALGRESQSTVCKEDAGGGHLCHWWVINQSQLSIFHIQPITAHSHIQPITAEYFHIQPIRVKYL